MITWFLHSDHMEQLRNPQNPITPFSSVNIYSSLSPYAVSRHRIQAFYLSRVISPDALPAASLRGFARTGMGAQNARACASPIAEVKQRWGIKYNKYQCNIVVRWAAVVNESFVPSWVRCQRREAAFVADTSNSQAPSDVCASNYSKDTEVGF